MTSQILQSVKKKIYAVCPEKMELSMGCLIRPKSKWLQDALWDWHYGEEKGREEFDLTVVHFEDSYRIGDSEDYSEAELEVAFTDFGGFSQLELFKKFPDLIMEDLEILGHPLGLPEVLRAIPDNYIEVRISKPFLLFVNHDTGISAKWNLLVNLDGQSEEVWKFLDKIL